MAEYNAEVNLDFPWSLNTFCSHMQKADPPLHCSLFKKTCVPLFVRSFLPSFHSQPFRFGSYVVLASTSEISNTWKRAIMLRPFDWSGFVCDRLFHLTENHPTSWPSEPYSMSTQHHGNQMKATAIKRSALKVSTWMWPSTASRSKSLSSSSISRNFR